VALKVVGTAHLGEVRETQWAVTVLTEIKADIGKLISLHQVNPSTQNINSILSHFNVKSLFSYKVRSIIKFKINVNFCFKIRWQGPVMYTR
jgi:type III secretory pathway component EscU